MEPVTVADFARLAQARLAGPVWDFIAGGAGDERTTRANVASFGARQLRPRVLAGVGEPDTSVEVFGARWAAPVAVAPMAYHTLVHHDGEVATVQGAAAVGLPVVVSVFAGRTVEDVAAHATGPLWFQLYGFRDRAQVAALAARAAKCCDALVFTVDTPRMGRRTRDLRNGFQLPPHVVAANLDDAIASPGEPAVSFRRPAAHSRTVMDPTLDWSFVRWLRGTTALPLVVKGILTGEDAARAVDAGADGIVVSNHGGRQLDGVVAAIDALPEVVDAVGRRCPVFVDGGVRRGTDVLVALALGATAVFVGRPVLYGLATAGAAGVRGVLSTVVDELADAMALAGRRTVADCDPSLVTAGWR